ncbi:MAG: glycosyltransferase, partial [Candidatus Korobacteraceae bacterium]
ELSKWGLPVLQENVGKKDKELDATNTMVAFEFAHYLQNQLLRDTDVMTMAHSVEARVPFLDQELVSATIGIPAQQRLRGIGSKPLLAEAMGNLLPQEIWDRPKRGFTLPMKRWLAEYDGILRSKPSARIVDTRAASRVWDAFKAGGMHWSRPWAIFVLERLLSHPDWKGTLEPVRPGVLTASSAPDVRNATLKVVMEAPERGLPEALPPIANQRTVDTPEKKQRIVVLLSDFFDAVGGIQTFNRCLVKALSDLAERRGLEIELLVLNDQPGASRPSPYFESRHASYSAFGRDRLAFGTAATLAARRCSTALIGHVNFAPLTASMKAASPRLNCRLVVHGIEAWTRLPVAQRWSLSLMDQVLSVSAFTRDEMRLRNGLSRVPFTVFPDTLDPLYARGSFTEAPRTQLGLPSGPMLLTVSRLHETEFYKRIDLLVKAMPQILREVPEAFAVVVGDGNGRRALEELAVRTGVGDRVKFTGRVDDDALASYYQACDVFVLPSLKEGFGIVFLEAMRFAKPCIGARAAAVPEVVLNGETGLLADPGDSRSLAEASVRILKDSCLRQKMGAAGQQRLTQNFSFEMFRNRLETLLCPIPRV